jgi:Rrf2 family nitric oxide-sensitive transcriptional repressor
VRLTQFSDYALRTLIYLGAHDERLVSVTEIARSYRISYNHLVKVTGRLVELGLVEAVRGRGGGLRLAADPSAISVGWLIRRTEPDLDLVECFNSTVDTCPITPACRLRHALKEARQAFLETLDGYTLADMLATPENRRALIQLWMKSARSALDAPSVS